MSNRRYTFADLAELKPAPPRQSEPLRETEPVGETEPPEESEPVAESEPAGETEPVRKITGVIPRTRSESPTPVRKRTGTPVLPARPPLESEPVRKVAPVLPGNAPHLRTPHVAIEEYFRRLKPAPRVILEEIYRAAAGWHTDECVISLGKLSQYTKIEGTKLREHLRTLIAEGFIERLPDVLGGTDLNMRGAHFRILVPRMAPPEKRTRSESQPGRESAPNKGSALNENDKKGITRLTPEEIQSFTATVADLLREGQSMEEIEPKFAPTMHAVDWATIRSTAQAQAQAQG
jgi:hypothetical protein